MNASSRSTSAAATAPRESPGAVPRALLFAVLAPVEWLVRRCSRVGPGPFYEPRHFQGLAAMEEQWASIRDELERVLAEPPALPALGDIVPSQGRLDDRGRWQAFFLHAYGEPVAANAARCPNTARLLANVPGLCTAFFSILAPGTRIPAHRGIFNGVARGHLGLQVPANPAANGTGCVMHIGGHTLRWREGRWLVFDDTQVHDVHNDTASPRVVLLVDVVRPQDFTGRMVTRGILGLMARSPFVTGARARLQAWSRRGTPARSR